VKCFEKLRKDGREGNQAGWGRGVEEGKHGREMGGGGAKGVKLSKRGGKKVTEI
jgi:hypothetical protein